MEQPLEERYPFLTAMAPAHIEYLRAGPLVTPEQFISILDDLDSEKRDKILWMSYKALVESMNEMGFPGKELSYTNFRSLCLRLNPGIGVLIVGGMIQMTLHLWLRLADVTSIEDTKSRVVDVTERLMADSQDSSDEFIAYLVDHIETLPEQTVENRKYYIYFATRCCNRSST